MYKVLVVDDNPDLRVLISRMLIKLGYDAREANNGIRGEEIAFAWEPDVILIGLMMPLQDGYTTCSNLRRDGYRGKIIVISALPGIWGSLEVTLTEADGYLSKPISMSVLRDCLETQFKVAA